MVRRGGGRGGRGEGGEEEEEERERKRERERERGVGVREIVVLTWKNPGGMGPPGMPSLGGMLPITGLGAAAAL